MTVSERIKLALRGNREARMLLIRDANRMIRRFVLQNPRVGDEEIIAIAKNRSADDELLRMIGDSREWTKNYQVRLSLATNPKTPLIALAAFPPQPERPRHPHARQEQERLGDGRERRQADRHAETGGERAERALERAPQRQSSRA